MRIGETWGPAMAATEEEGGGGTGTWRWRQRLAFGRLGYLSGCAAAVFGHSLTDIQGFTKNQEDAQDLAGHGCDSYREKK